MEGILGERIRKVRHTVSYTGSRVLMEWGTEPVICDAVMGKEEDGMTCYREGVVGTLRGSIRTLVTGSPRRNQQGWRSQA